MKMILDFDNNTIETEQGILAVPDLHEKKDDILKVIGVSELSGEELKNDIRGLLNEIGMDDVIDA